MQASCPREQWLRYLLQLTEPVLGALAERQLRATMPIRANAPDRRRPFAHLEAFGRLLAGIAPWLEQTEVNGTEEAHRRHWHAAAVEAIDAATDPRSPDYMNFGRDHGNQPLVDTAFLAQGLLRAPSLWEALSGQVRRQVLTAFRETRSIQPVFNNWLMFAGMIEAFFCRVGEAFDRMRLDYALRQHEQWYLGDGTYGDGPHYHWDYYNSFVIQPMLLDTLDAVAEHHDTWAEMGEAQQRRARRQAVILERLIGPDGSYPPIGRSLVYRGGAFQLLGQMALRNDLPEQLHPGQVREAMTRMLRRTLDPPGTFDDDGWLQAGLCGHQPGLRERYISTGSLYLAACGLLPLGLPAEAAFWVEPGVPTCDRVWSGQDFPADHAED